jgi:hypothetical protein
MNEKEMNPMKKYIVATLAAAALASGLGAPAGAETQTLYTDNPVTLRGVTVNPVLMPRGGPSTYTGFDFIPTSSDVTISFVNTANVPAKIIEFAVRSGNRTALIVDKGTFAPGTSVVHTFTESTEFDNKSSVHIQAVTFADGSTWNG